MEEKKELLTRIACCVVAALVVYYIGDEMSEHVHIELLEKYKPWLEENKIQAIAIVTAVLFGLSLAAFPLPPEEKEEEELDY
jgi:hypothetical protein